MGLDMYLFRKRKTRNDEGDEVAYWRKANQIREWFVRNCGYNTESNLESVSISKEQLEKLVEDCERVIADHSLAEEVLPTSDGFFFGDTKYDEWYFNVLTYTAEKVKEILKVIDWEVEEVDYYEWW